MATPWPSGDPRSTAERPERVVQRTHIAVRYRPREPVSPRTRSAGRLRAVGWVAGWVITGVGVAVVLAALRDIFHTLCTRVAAAVSAESFWRRSGGGLAHGAAAAGAPPGQGPGRSAGDGGRRHGLGRAHCARLDADLLAAPGGWLLHQPGAAADEARRAARRAVSVHGHPGH